MSENSPKIAIAADHAGFELKQSLKEWLLGQGYTVQDLGTDSEDAVDYPDFGVKLGKVIQDARADMGVAVCGSGIGISIALNRFSSVRSALCRDADDAKMARRHNNANVLSLGARKTSADEALEILKVFLETEFEGGRHARRVEKLGGCGLHE